MPQKLPIYALRLRERRTKLDMPPDRLAAFAKISPEQIIHFENGQEDIPASVLGVLASVLGISSDWLLGLSEDPTPDRKELNRLEIELLSAFRSKREHRKKALIKIVELLE